MRRISYTERTQQDIEEDVLKVQKQLKLYKQELQSAILRDTVKPLKSDRAIYNKDNMRIGNFDLNRTHVVLKALHDGETLVVSNHHGRYFVKMNGGRNRFIVRKFGKPNDMGEGIREDNILDYMMRYAADWFIVTHPELLEDIHSEE